MVAATIKDIFTPLAGVDLDVIQRFRFNGKEALEQHAIDMLITSDPIHAPHLINIPVFKYALKLITAPDHALAKRSWINPEDLAAQTLFTFPVDVQRLDVFTQFLIPAGVKPQAHTTLEALEIMLLLVAQGRGVCTLPDWLAAKLSDEYAIQALGLGEQGYKNPVPGIAAGRHRYSLHGGLHRHQPKRSRSRILKLCCLRAPNRGPC